MDTGSPYRRQRFLRKARERCRRPMGESRARDGTESQPTSVLPIGRIAPGDQRSDGDSTKPVSIDISSKACCPLAARLDGAAWRQTIIRRIPSALVAFETRIPSPHLGPRLIALEHLCTYNKIGSATEKAEPGEKKVTATRLPAGAAPTVVARCSNVMCAHPKFIRTTDRVGR